MAGFDYDQTVALIDENVSNPLLNTTLKKGLDAAKDNPELLQTALDAVKAAIGQ